MIEDNPEEWVFDLFTADYYRGDPLGLPVLGRRGERRAANEGGLLEHFRTHHSPSNMIITAVGRIDHDALVKKVDALFGGLVDGGRMPLSLEKPESFPGVYVYEKDLEHIYLCLAADGVSQTDTRRYALYVLNAIVGGSMSSHLFQEIREKRGLVYNIFSYVNCYNDVGNFGIATSSSPECMEEVIALIREETAKLKKQGITAGELAFSKEHIKGNFFMSLEGSEARMGRLAKNEIYFDRYVPVKQTLKQIDSVHAPQVDEMSRLVFGDEGSMALAVLGKVDRATIERLWKS